jgi:hypothetical protein
MFVWVLHTQLETRKRSFAKYEDRWKMGLQQHFNEMINRFLMEMVRRRGIVLAHEELAYVGIIRWRELPFTSPEEYQKWWLPLRDSGGRIIRSALMSEREKSRYTVHEDHNILTSSGRQYLLTYLSSTSANTPPFAQYFAIGNFPINSVDPGDTSVQGEIYRAVPSTTTITGTQLDLDTFIPSGSALGTYTNVGLLGVNAVGTLGGAGTLMTHALSTYNKGSIAVTASYLLNLT